MSAPDDDPFDDLQQTAIDPDVPTGGRGRPAQFDPHARVADHRKPVAGAGRPVVHQVIAALPPVRRDDPIAPNARVHSSFDPHGRIDDSSRTAKWVQRENAGRGGDEARAETPTGIERAKSPTQRGNARRAPTAQPAGPRARSEPMRAISMKTPGGAQSEKAQRVLPVVQLRAISELHQTPTRGMGNLAPPRDPRDVRFRRVRDNVIWGSVALILASIVTLAIWFLARR